MLLQQQTRISSGKTATTSSHALIPPRCPAAIARRADTCARRGVPPSATARPSCRQVSCSASARTPGVFLFGFGQNKTQSNNAGYDDDDDDESLTVVKLTVGMFGDIRRFQRLLERMSDGYEDGDEDSLHAIMEDTITMILRNIQFVGYGATAGKLFDYLEQAESKFNSVVMEERSKFREETYVNVDGRQRRRVAMELGNAAANGLDEWLAVTLVIATERGIKLPPIRSVQDMRKALTKLAGISVDDLIAFELLWTPQADGDSYSKDELLLDYPSLAAVN